jgi:single-strand DNA-binding protein
MARDLNKAFITGRLGADPELKSTPQGKMVCSFTVASNANYKIDGQTIEKTNWSNVVVWGKLGEICGQYLSKGSRVFAEGETEFKQWEKDGIKYNKTEINCTNVIFLDSKQTSDKPKQDIPNSNINQDDDLPF